MFAGGRHHRCWCADGLTGFVGMREAPAEKRIVRMRITKRRRLKLAEERLRL